MMLGLDDVRDIIIIVSGSLLLLLLLAMLIVTVVLGVSVRLLTSTVRGLLDNEVKPLVRTARETAENVRGGASFVNEAVARPIIRLYGFLAALRRIIAVLLGLRHRRSE